MKLRIMLCAIGLLLPVTVLAQQVVRQRPVTLQLDVNAQGRVTAAKVMEPGRIVMKWHGRVRVQKSPRGPLPDVFAKAAVQVASNWRFQPPAMAGRSLSGRTYATATLEVLKQPDGTFQIALLYRDNGPYIDYHMVPRYPVEMREHARVAGMVVEATLNPDGSMSDVRVTKAFTNGRDHGASFRKAAEEAVSAWKGEPMQVDGHAVASHVCVPMFFEVSTIAKDQMQRIRSQVRATMEARSMRHVPAGPIHSGEMVALDNPFVKQPSS